MKKLLHCWFVGCCFFLFVHAAHAENGLERISEHVYAYLDVENASPTNSFGANAGVIIGEKGIIVIDTLISSKELSVVSLNFFSAR